MKRRIGLLLPIAVLLLAGNARAQTYENPIDFHIPSVNDLQNADNSIDYYMRQILTVVHEFGHLHGLGISEYYNLRAPDMTGVAPIEDLVQVSPLSPYWSQRPLPHEDPMRGCADY